MDYQRSSLIAFIACVLSLGSCGQQSEKPAHLRGELPDAVKWAHPDTDMVELLTVEPAECLSVLSSAEGRERVLFGKIAFRSPYLLGGQAARRRFSCNTCHTNGHINEHFFIEGLSDLAGTADVSNFHFSKTLGDGVFNPKPIPSLRDMVDADSAKARRIREAFILRLVEKEFSGAAPSNTTKEALISYVDMLGNAVCTDVLLKDKEMLYARLNFIDQVFGLLKNTTALSEQETRFVRASLRAELGHLYRRFPNAAELQNDLEKISRRLSGFETPIADIVVDWEVLARDLANNFSQSLFNVRTVAHLNEGVSAAK
jgi:hypothetical protein